MIERSAFEQAMEYRGKTLVAGELDEPGRGEDLVWSRALRDQSLEEAWEVDRNESGMPSALESRLAATPMTRVRLCLCVWNGTPKAKAL